LWVMALPTEGEIITYFPSVGPGTMMNPLAMTPTNTVQLARLCPIPHSWATYFRDSKSPFDAWRMGCSLITTLDMVDQQDRALPLANWLQVTCVK
jgi:hypothetical protein